MKNILTKLSAVALLSGSMLMSTSCVDQLNQESQDWPAFGTYWKAQNEFTGNIYALAQMFRGYNGNILFWAGELRAGQFTTALINSSGPLNEDYIYNNYDIAHSQFGNFMNTPGFIADLNELIYYCELQEDESILTNAVKNALLGVAYGWRAYTYFQVYKMYGGAVIRTEPDVLFGERNPDVLDIPRSSAEATLQFIKDDIGRSLAAWNASGMNYLYDAASFANNGERDYYWNKPATEMLAGEVYLWSAKVSTGNHKATGASDVATAKQYFQNVINNYGYSLYGVANGDWFGIWTTPHNSEAIFGFCESNTKDGAYASWIQPQVTWSKAAGAETKAWSVQGPTGFDKTAWDEATGTFANASRFGFYSTDPSKQGTQYSNWIPWNPSPNRYLWKNALYYQFDQMDGRTDMWFPQWTITTEQEVNGVYAIANFDPTQYDLMGTFILKFIPTLTEQYPNTLYNWNDQYIYRLTLAYTYMAEIANYEGNYGEIANWINPIRQRAYGKNWDVNKYGFQSSTFAENEAQILREKNKEFIMEGQRWWDLRRMTTVKDGSDTDHMVFQPQGCIGYGLNPAANPWMVEAGGVGLIETQTPVLSTNEAYKLLWPLDATLLNSDPTLKQNPGYENPNGAGTMTD